MPPRRGVRLGPSHCGCDSPTTCPHQPASSSSGHQGCPCRGLSPSEDHHSEKESRACRRGDSWVSAAVRGGFSVVSVQCLLCSSSSRDLRAPPPWKVAPGKLVGLLIQRWKASQHQTELPTRVTQSPPTRATRSRITPAPTADPECSLRHSLQRPVSTCELVMTSWASQ